VLRNASHWVFGILAILTSMLGPSQLIHVNDYVTANLFEQDIVKNYRVCEIEESWLSGAIE
jgi:hypothetical protein